MTAAEEVGARWGGAGVGEDFVDEGKELGFYSSFYTRSLEGIKCALYITKWYTKHHQYKNHRLFVCACVCFLSY